MRRGQTLAAAMVAASIALVLAAPIGLAGPLGAGPAPIYVESLGPSGDAVPTDALIEVVFTDAVARSTFGIRFEPAVAGEPKWVDDYTLHVQPVGLRHSTTYEVRVRGRSVSGGVLRGQRTFHFTTDAGVRLAMSPGPAAVRIPMLLYHYIQVISPRDYMGWRLSVTPTDFASQMAWLAKNGYHPVTLRDVLDFLKGKHGLPDKPIVLTFDDGYVDFYTNAVPVLRSHDFSAVAFVVSGFLGRAGYMSEEQVVAAHSAGFEIGGHTVDHVSLTRQSNDGLRYQVSACKEQLERLLGEPVVSFAYPYGNFGAREVGAVQAAGYEAATVTSVSDSWRSLSNRFVWSRIRVLGGENLSQFAYALATA